MTIYFFLYILIDEKIKIILLILEGYMKKFNTIILLLSLVGSISGMKELPVVKKSIDQVKDDQWFIKLDKESSKIIDLYVGNNIKYFKEYKAQEYDNNTLFPLKSPYFLPIEHCGSLRFFVSSAIGGSKENPGAAYVISDSAIIQICIVRCIDKSILPCVDKSNDNTANIYLGIERYKGELRGCNKVYSTRILLLQVKQKDSSAKELCCYKTYPMYNYVKKFNRSELLLEIKNHVSSELSVNLENPIIQEKAQKLLGKRVKDFDFEGQFFVFSEDYIKEIIAAGKELK